MPARTTQPYRYFDDLDPGQFEDLVGDLLHRERRTWLRLDPVGRAGSDRGRDLVGDEQVGRGQRVTTREWRIQVKRVQRLTPASIRKIVRDAVPKKSPPPYGLVLAAACRVSSDGFDAFYDEAQKRGVKHSELWSRDTLNRKLLAPKNGDLRSFYFGDTRAIEGTVRIPLGLDQSIGRDAPLLGRQEILDDLKADDVDAIVEGLPGTGKSRIVLELAGVRFLNHEAQSDAIRDSLLRHRPRTVVIDDAGFDLDRVRTLLELRRHGHRFRIIATTWPQHTRDVRRLLTTARVIRLPLLERHLIDEVLKSLGASNPIFRHFVLDQAEGRLGWAIALLDLALRGDPRSAVSGRGLIDEVEPYLRRAGANSIEALGLMSVIAALGEVKPGELGEVDDYVGIGRLDRAKLLAQAAAAGVLDSDEDGSLRIAPRRFRLALAAHWFYEQEHAPWPLNEVLDRWPAHHVAIVEAALHAALAGSAGARADLDALIPSVTSLPESLAVAYVAVSDQTARRAVAETARLPSSSHLKVEVLKAAAHQLVPEAVRALLDMGVVDARAEGPSPDHPIRVLGEIGTSIDPNGFSSFATRRPLLDVATDWFDEDPTARGEAWAHLVVHLLGPTASGNYTDPGSPRTVHMQAGYETGAALQTIEAELWPPVATRLTLLDDAAVSVLSELLDAWARVAHGISGAFGSVPRDDAREVAAAFLPTLTEALQAATEDKPAARVCMRQVSDMFKLGIRPPGDWEFRVLTWDAWKVLRRGHGEATRRIAAKLADCWAADGPSSAMRRLAHIAAQARATGRDLHPMIRPVMIELAALVADDLDAWIDAGLHAGLTTELEVLFAKGSTGPASAPTWLDAALGGGARATVILAVLASGPSDAADRVIAALEERDAYLVESIVWRGDQRPNDVARALLQHPNDAIRGNVSLALDPAGRRHIPAVPPDWYGDWAAAFEVAPLGGSLRHNHRLDEILDHLVTSDPDLVERWLLRALTPDFTRAVFALRQRDESPLARLPRPNRDRLMRQFAGEPASFQLLAHLLGDDADWLDELLQDGVVDVENALVALGNIGEDGKARIPTIMRHARPFLAAGVEPKALAARAVFGVGMGEASDRYEALRAEFEATSPSSDEAAEQVRQEGIRVFTEERDRERDRERERRVRGEL